ncbi:MAG TPA: ester cyclase [Symbiobacteriaceae bacterium]|nr:ester cyclase [Symbiobacteriaceae bacterium]
MLTYEPVRMTKAFLECWNNRNPQPFFELLAPSAMSRVIFEKDERPARQVAEEYLKSLTMAFPDLTWTIRDTVAAERTLTIEWQAAGTHAGMFREIPPTYRRVELRGTTILKINEDAKIVRETVYVPLHLLLRQIGVLPAPVEEKKLREAALAFIDTLNRHDIEALLTFLVPEPVVLLETGVAIDKEAVRETIAEYLVAVPDSRVTVNHIAIRGNEVVAELLLEGKHEAPLFQIAPTHKQIKWGAMLRFTFAGEKIAKIHLYQDLFTLLNQIGAVPELAVK